MRAIEKAAICGGLTFDAAADMTESIGDVLAALVQASAARGYEYRELTNGMFLPLLLDPLKS